MGMVRKIRPRPIVASDALMGRKHKSPMIDQVAAGDRKHLPGIHGLRATAALLIVALHVIGLGMWMGKPMLEVPPSFYASLSHMALGVHLFFIISIFSLLHSYERAAEREGWIIVYGIKRFFRIAPLFYAMIVYNYGYYITALPGTMIANMLFIFNFIPGMHTSAVAAGWTIGLEMPIYIILPFLIRKFRTLAQVTTLTVVAGIVSIAARLLLANISLPDDYVYYAMPSNVAVFAVGAMAYHLVKAYRSNVFFRCAVATGSIFSLAAMMIIPNTAPLGSPRLDILLWSVSFGLLCMWQAVRPSRVLSSRPMQWIGERSFSVYLLHPLIVVQLINSDVYPTIYSALHFIGAWAYLVCVSVTIGLVLLAAAITYRLIEIPGQRLGGLLIRLLVKDYKPRLVILPPKNVPQG